MREPAGAALRAIIVPLVMTAAYLLPSWPQSGGTQGAAAHPDSAAAVLQADSVPAGPAVSLTSTPSGARVYRDTSFLGTTPLVFMLEESRYDSAGDSTRQIRLKITGGDPWTWFQPVLTDTIEIPPAGSLRSPVRDTLRRHYEIPVAVRVTSEPPGADVLLGDSLLGVTPLFVSVPWSPLALRLEKEGYRPDDAVLYPGIANYRGRLAPLDSAGAPAPSPLYGVTGRSNTPLYVGGGAAVVSGALAAWFKNRADNYYEDYRAGGDPGALDRVRRFDLLSGIALTVAEISLGYLIIELLSR